MDKNKTPFTDDHIYKLLPVGSGNAISMSELADVVGLSTRELREHLTHLRINGAIVGGDTSGYYIPDTEGELKAIYKRIFNRARTGFKVLKPVKEELKRRGYTFVHGQPVKDRQQIVFKL